MRTHTIRPTSSLAVWLIGLAFGCWVLLDLARGDRSALVHAGGPVLLALWVLALVLARPAVRYGEDGLVVLNPLVQHEIGWGAVEAVDRRMQLVVVATGGRRFVAWGSPTLRRSRPGQEEHPDWARQELLNEWEGARLAGRPLNVEVRRRPDVPMLAAGVVLVIATVAGLTL